MATISDLFEILDHYVQGQVSLGFVHDRLSLNLQDLTKNASEDELERLSEILAGLYEVEDGVLDEETYRLLLWELIAAESISHTITVGDPLLNTYSYQPLGTSSSATDTLVLIPAT